MMKLKKRIVLNIICSICAVFLLGTGVTVFANEDEISSEEVSVGTFHEVSDDGENVSGEEVSVGTFYAVSNKDEVPADTLIGEDGKSVSVGVVETLDEE